jgi:hypothetical protein
VVLSRIIPDAEQALSSATGIKLLIDLEILLKVVLNTITITFTLQK